jgi:subtilisin family serine protease
METENNQGRTRFQTGRALSATVLLLSFLMISGFELTAEQKTHPNRILVMPKKGVPENEFARWTRNQSVRELRSHPRLGGLRVLGLPQNLSTEQAIHSYQASGLVEFAEPDYILRAYVSPNDPAYLDGTLWGLHNSFSLGAADIHAPEAWDETPSATNVIVAVVDSGVRYTHEDLADNMWVNPGEIPDNGIDDDQNGIIDDVHGFNAITGSGEPTDEAGHGTHVAGIIGAVGNNGKGSVGVAWRVQLMALKFLDRDGEGPTSDAIECIDYARAHGAQVINASWGSTAKSRSLQRAIERAQADGIIFVTAAGNDTRNTDRLPDYPAGYALDNVISVAATDRADQLAEFSNYGQATVDLAAPGVEIYSCWNTSGRAYQAISGTSMAAPYVAGVFALLRSRHPSASYQDLIAALLSSADPLESLQGTSVTGGRLNAARALEALRPLSPEPFTLNLSQDIAGRMLRLRVTGRPETAYRLEESNDLYTWTEVRTGVTDSNGNLDVDILPSEARKFFRATRP